MLNLGHFLFGMIVQFGREIQNIIRRPVVSLFFKGSGYVLGLYLQHFGNYLRKGSFSINVH